MTGSSKQEKKNVFDIRNIFSDRILKTTWMCSIHIVMMPYSFNQFDGNPDSKNSKFQNSCVKNVTAQAYLNYEIHFMLSHINQCLASCCVEVIHLKVLDWTRNFESYLLVATKEYININGTTCLVGSLAYTYRMNICENEIARFFLCIVWKQKISIMFSYCCPAGRKDIDIANQFLIISLNLYVTFPDNWCASGLY